MHDFVVVANRLPVDRVEDAGGGPQWRTSPGGLVTALEPVLRASTGAWVGWSGAAGPIADEPTAQGMSLRPVELTEQEISEYYSGFCNATLWPLYHDVIAPPQFHRDWWRAYQQVNRKFAAVAAAQAARGAQVWVHDYQLQLVPAMLREMRPDLRIGFFNHIPFPGYEIFAQLPWRRAIVKGLLGADLLGFQRQQDVTNFMRACRRAADLPTRGASVWTARQVGTAPDTAGDGPPAPDRARRVIAGAFPISIDTAALQELAASSDVVSRAKQIRSALGDPRTLLLGVDRLDYTKGILHRLKAYEELLADGRIGPPDEILVQVASPSRERVEQYQHLREEVESIVGRINGDHGQLGQPAVHYLHQSYPREEMAALYLAADVLLVTALRDGMNLVAKEYVACRADETGRLVLSEFTGAADELTAAFMVNPHDIDGLKDTIERAVHAGPADVRRRMRSMRRRVQEHDVADWASSFLGALNS